MTVASRRVTVAHALRASRPRLNGKPRWHAQPEPLRGGYGADSAVLLCCCASSLCITLLRDVQKQSAPRAGHVRLSSEFL